MIAAPRILTEIPKRLFAIGDIHGCNTELQWLLKHLEDDEGLDREDTIIFIGDYIDRGSDSKGVVDTLIALHEKYPRTFFLRGNHEEMLLSFLGIGDSRFTDVFLANGGEKTLKQFGIDDPTSPDAPGLFPKEYIEFFTDLDRYIVTAQYVFVHAGLHPLVELLQQNDKDIYWIRDEFIRNVHRFEKTVIFGHTPFQEVLLHLPYKIGIDTGLVYGSQLSCIELTTKQLFQVTLGASPVKKIALKIP